MTIIKFSSSDDDSSDSWVSIADMMAGLMMIFLLLAVWHVASNISSDTDIEPPPVNGGEGGPTGAGGTGVDVPLIDPVKKWRDLEDAIYRALVEEFEHDLPKWHAEIERETLTVRFNAPEIFFDKSSAELKEEFGDILGEFFPRYIRVLHDGSARLSYGDSGEVVHFAREIREVRIEGHTSSEFAAANDVIGKFIGNMELSQDRTRAVMKHGLGLKEVKPFEDWIITTVTANGLSSGRLKSFPGTNEEDKERSRRVEFTIRTDTRKVLEALWEQKERQSRGG